MMRASLTYIYAGIALAFVCAPGSTEAQSSAKPQTAATSSSPQANGASEPLRDPAGNVVHKEAVSEGEAKLGKPTETEPAAGAPTIARNITKPAKPKTGDNKPLEIEPQAGAPATASHAAKAQGDAPP